MKLMGTKSKIEWTDHTWNPTTGCSYVSEGCRNCYAVKMSSRLASMGVIKYAGIVTGQHFNGAIKTVRGALDYPLSLPPGSKVFVNSMSDLFHPCVPVAFIVEVFQVMARCPKVVFQVLTKRPEAMKIFLREKRSGFSRWPLPNVWVGTSCEDQATADQRIPHLLKCPAAVRFLSCEPLLGWINFVHGDGGNWVIDLLHGTRSMPDHDDPDWDFNGSILGPVDWVIVGGESGPKARPMHPDWARSIRDQCVSASVPFFFKQWGGRNKKKAGRELDGRTWDQMPRKVVP